METYIREDASTKKLFLVPTDGYERRHFLELAAIDTRIKAKMSGEGSKRIPYIIIEKDEGAGKTTHEIELIQLLDSLVNDELNLPIGEYRKAILREKLNTLRKK